MSHEEIKKNELDTLVYKPEVIEKRTISFVWVLPLIVLAILGWVAYESYSKKGTNITIIFKNAEGLKEGVTPLEYKGLPLGKVTKININDLDSVKVNVLVNSEVADFVATDAVSFWIRKPTVSLTKISGLGTILSGNKIEVAIKSKNIDELQEAKPKYEFIGLDTKPNFDLDGKGYYVSILSTKSNLVEVETPIFYNKFQIGEIVSKEFENENVYLKAYIYNRYNDLVNESSHFIMNKALKVNFGAAGLSLQLSSLYSALIGGITVETPNKNAQKMPKDKYYVLYENENELLKKTFLNIKLTSAKGVGKGTSIMYKGIEVGKISELHLSVDDVIAKAYVFDKYKYLLTNKSTMHLEEVEVGFDGVKNLNTLIKGEYISINYQKGEPKFFFEIEKKDSLKSLDNDLLITLYSDKLNSISKKSKIYFKNIEIGEVINYSLTKDYKRVKINVFIKKEYKNLINDRTLFYDISSKLVEFKNLNLDINYSGVKPLLDGGIAIVDIKRGEKLTKKIFKLYNSYEDVQRLRREQTQGSFITAYFDNSFKIKKNQTISYKSQEIGFVDSIKFNDKKSKVKIFIYSKYKKYLSKKSRFYKADAIKFDASLSGVFFELDNLSSLVYGSINLDNSSNKDYKNYNIYASKDDMINSSNTLTLFFDDVEGLKTEFSKIVYKGVTIGKVTNIFLTSKNKVGVKVQIFKDFDKFSRKGTIFYLKKPEISLSEIKNIGSAILPIDIGIIQSSIKSASNSFKGYNSFADIKKREEGKILKVISYYPTSVNSGAPIYYKNVEIGKVNKIDLSFDGSKVLLDCLIYNKYSHLVRVDSNFYDISGFKFKFSIFGDSKIETNTFTSILKGGLMVVTPYKYNEIATSKDKFILNKDLMENWEKINPSIKIRD